MLTHAVTFYSCVAGDEATRRRVRVFNIKFTTTAQQLHSFFTTVQRAAVKKVTLFPVRAEQRIRGPAVSSGQGVVEFEDAGTAQRLIAAKVVYAPGVAHAPRGQAGQLRWVGSLQWC
jgi:hypothetical protein